MKAVCLDGFTPFFGRILLSAIFIASGLSKILDWPGTVQAMQAENMQYVQFLLFGAILFEVVGGFMVLLGFHARLGTLLLLGFLVPTTVIFHDFWQYSGQARVMQQIQFMKNAAICGGLLLLLRCGAGYLAVDAIRLRRREPYAAPIVEVPAPAYRPAIA